MSNHESSALRLDDETGSCWEGALLGALPMQTFLDDCVRAYRSDGDGMLADYIPELTRSNPDHFGIALCTIDGHVYASGDASVPFTIQSVSKAFVFALALEVCGHQRVGETIGVEPSGDAFNSIRLRADNRPYNPMVNAGAIACSALIYEHDPDHAFEQIRDTLGRFAGRDLDLDQSVFESENATGDRNRAIAWLLKNNKIIRTDVDGALEAYFKQCALLVTARDLAIMGATLANNGINPITGETVVSPITSARVLSVMVSSGMYDYSGEWIYRVGLPAKSGVGGGIVSVLPAQMGLGTYSPLLDPLGNSVRGLKVCERVSASFGLHLLERQGDVSSNIAADYYLSETHSHTDRRLSGREILQAHGHSVHVIELAGALNFVACDYVTRRLQRITEQDIEIFDFRRVAGMSSAASMLLVACFVELVTAGKRVVIASLPEGVLPHRTLQGAIEADAKAAALIDNIRRFATLNDAVAWAEDQIIFLHGGFDQIGKPVDIREQHLLLGLDDTQIAKLLGLMREIDLKTGERVVKAGDVADSVYFLQSGMVSVVLSNGVRVATLNAGACFGELALISKTEIRSADIVADTSSHCYELDAATYELLLRDEPEIIETILKNLGSLLAEKLRHATAKIETLSR